MTLTQALELNTNLQAVSNQFTGKGSDKAVQLLAALRIAIDNSDYETLEPSEEALTAYFNTCISKKLLKMP